MRILTILASAMLVTSVMADEIEPDWKVLTEDTMDIRTLVDVNSFQYGEYTDSKDDIWAGVMTRFSNSSEMFSSRIDVKDCLTKGSGNLTTQDKTGEQSLFFWTDGGDKIYDIVGQAICLKVSSDFIKHKEEQKNK